jgi:hypothetical protein
MNFPVRGSDQATVVAVISPVSQGAGTLDSGWIAAADFAQFLAIINDGVLGAAATLDAKLQQAQDSSGTGVKDITGLAITQQVKATDDNKGAIINFRPPKLDRANSFTHFRLRLTVGTAASLVSAVLLGLGARNQPGTHATAIKEVVG